MIERSNGRSESTLRPLTITPHVLDHAPGSVLLSLGKTKVLCAVTLQPGVPSFLRGTKTGWLTAEYCMLPAATKQRTVRESSSGKRNGRNVEISRLIGRCLRSVVNLGPLGERTIYLDCDVLQADGGTRTACITGAFVALRLAVDHWLATKQLAKDIITDELAAVSVGVKNSQELLDLDYAEDATCDADVNFVMTRSEKIIEVQGAAEGAPITWQQFKAMRKLAVTGIAHMWQVIDQLHLHDQQRINVGQVGNLLAQSFAQSHTSS